MTFIQLQNWLEYRDAELHISRKDNRWTILINTDMKACAHLSDDPMESLESALMEAVEKWGEV